MKTERAWTVEVNLDILNESRERQEANVTMVIIAHSVSDAARLAPYALRAKYGRQTNIQNIQVIAVHSQIDVYISE